MMFMLHFLLFFPFLVDSQSPPEGSTSTTERRQLRLAEFHAPPPPDTPPPPETPSDCPSQGYPQSEDDGVRDRGGVDEAVQVQRSPLGSPREGDDQSDSVTEDMSPKSVLTATEDETTMTSQTSGTDFKDTSDVASFIEQISQFADEPVAPSSGNTADEAETLPLSADCVDAASLRDKTTTLPLTDGVEQDVTSCQVKSSAPSIHEEFSAIAEVTMPTEVLHQRNKDSHMEVTVTTESVDRTRDDDHENVSMATEDVQQIPEEVSMATENDTETQVVLDETARNSLSEEACPMEDLGLPAVVYKVPVKAVNNRNKQSSAVTKEPTTQLCTSVPDEGRAETTTDKTPDELYTFSVTTEYVIKDNVLPTKEQPSPSKDQLSPSKDQPSPSKDQPSPSKDQPAPSTPEATVKDDATLFKVPSVPRMKQTPRVNSLREVYRKPILNNTYLGDSTGHVNSVARELIPPPLSAASRETAGKSNRDVGRKSSYDSIAKFTGPQPWGSRYQSEPSVKDIRKALLIRRESSLTRDMSSPGDRSSVVQESPSRNSSFSSSSEINFQPNSADESQSVLEEKSISMIALSSERKSTPRKTSTWSDRRRYSSMVSLATQNEPTLSLLPSQTIQNSSSMEQLALTPNSRDKARRTLQSQYSELQMQFSKWQQQLMTNQALLTQKNLLRKSDRPRDTSVERDGYRRATSRAAAEKRRSFIDERPASDEKDVRRVTSGVASEKRRSLIDDRPAMQDTTQEIREGTVEDLTSLGCQEPREGTAASSGDRVMRLSTGLWDTGLGGKFTPGELSTAKRVLRQNSNEVQGSTTVFKAVSQSNSPAQAAPPAWRSGSPIQRVTSPVRQSRSPTRQSRSQGRWSGSPARRMGSPTQRTGSPPPGILLTNETPPAQEVSSTQVTKAASSTQVTKAASSTQVTKTASSTQVTKAASSTQVTKTASSRSREVNRKRFEPKLDPREELMIAIRNAGAKNMLKKAATTDDK
ncbi:hypothetical protein LSAT2_024320 [Lamellibrachia satsuma]|nr:hypothetical protein LSAT2_024320 [Lamellibrachia satsuma]